MRQRLETRTRRAACLAACIGLALCVQAQPRQHHHVSIAGKLRLDRAYYAGHVVNIHLEPLKKGEHPRIVGPWYFGPRIDPRPNDKRPNLYVICPGSRHQVEGDKEYEHNEVLSAVPQDSSDFDVWWVVVLDPKMQEEFHGEKELLVAAQKEFQPPADFTFDQIPGAALLRNVLHIHTLSGLDKFRRPDGDLPRIAIVNAHFSIRAHVEESSNSTAADQEQEAQ